MKVSEPLAREVSLALRFAAVCLLGFLVDYLALRAGLGLGLGAPAARLISLVLGLQVTFGLSRRLVFIRRGLDGIGGEWGRFMVANGFGGVCNYGIFVALTATRWPIGAGLWIPLILSGGVAYGVNYAGTRLFVYGRGRLAPEGVVVGPKDPAAVCPEP